VPDATLRNAAPSVGARTASNTALMLALLSDDTPQSEPVLPWRPARNIGFYRSFTAPKRAEAYVERSKKARQLVESAGLIMVGVARIELATPAMSTQRFTGRLLSDYRRSAFANTD
jgi:hypothetical protein